MKGAGTTTFPARSGKRQCAVPLPAPRASPIRRCPPTIVSRGLTLAPGASGRVEVKARRTLAGGWYATRVKRED
jgi:hypothetical protein